MSITLLFEGYTVCLLSLQWRHDGRGSVSSHQHHDCLLNRLFRLISRKTSKLRVTGLCAGNSPVTGEFLTKMSSNTKNVSIWWRHHVSESPRMETAWGTNLSRIEWWNQTAAFTDTVSVDLCNLIDTQVNVEGLNVNAIKLQSNCILNCNEEVNYVLLHQMLR